MELPQNREITDWEELAHGKVRIFLECGHVFIYDAQTFEGLATGDCVGKVTSCASCPPSLV